MHLSWKVAFLTYEHKCTVCMSCVLIKKGCDLFHLSFPFFFCCILIFLWFSWILLKREIPDGLWLFYYMIVCVVNSCWLPTGHCWSKWANISDGSHQQTKWTWWCSSQVLHQLKIFTKLTCHNMYLYLY